MSAEGRDGTSALVIGLDFGTSSAKGCVIRAKSQGAEERLVFSCEAVTYEGQTQSVESWTDALYALLIQIPEALRRRAVRISLDATSATSICLNTAQVLMYDQGVGREVVELLKKYAPAESCVLSGSSSLAKLVFWLLESPPAGSALRFCHQADFLLRALVGSPVEVDGASHLIRYLREHAAFTSDWNNALKLGYDPEADEYPAWLIEGLLNGDPSLKDKPIPELPKVVRPGAVLGSVGFPFNALLPPDCQVCAGTTDSIAAFLASGCCQLGDACTSLGSTLAIKMLSQRRVESVQHGIYSHRFPTSGSASDRLWLVGGASNCGCRVLRDLKFTVEELRALSEEIDPQSPTGFHFYPLPLNATNGERFPDADPQKISTVDPSVRPRSKLLHAVFESIARVELSAYEKLYELGAECKQPLRLFSAGGGSENGTWSRMRSTLIYGVPEAPQMCAAESSEACYGAALLAADFTE
ncbi:Xylulose kinase [Porphyridium purpureum]|uniref:Xylulose kinase n=1 Tax=Porphyridium purpureum TaxID=35688 RepID=A0A5J4YND7_PORPP|nr:Xylulose kinase [Porphyridium purpureum]|eukprot:POR0870..scf222_8